MNNNLKINDIKSIVEVSDYSFYFFILLILSSLIICSLLIYFTYTKIKNKDVNYQKIYIRNLKNIDTTKSKKAAYEITKYIQLISKNESQTKLANELILKLESYKYKKESKKFDKKTVNLYKSLMDSL